MPTLPNQLATLRKVNFRFQWTNTFDGNYVNVASSWSGFGAGPAMSSKIITDDEIGRTLLYFGSVDYLTVSPTSITAPTLGTSGLGLALPPVKSTDKIADPYPYYRFQTFHHMEKLLNYLDEETQYRYFFVNYGNIEHGIAFTYAPYGDYVDYATNGLPCKIPVSQGTIANNTPAGLSISTFSLTDEGTPGRVINIPYTDRSRILGNIGYIKRPGFPSDLFDAMPAGAKQDWNYGLGPVVTPDTMSLTAFPSFTTVFDPEFPWKIVPTWNYNVSRVDDWAYTPPWWEPGDPLVYPLAGSNSWAMEISTGGGSGPYYIWPYLIPFGYGTDYDFINFPNDTFGSYNNAAVEDLLYLALNTGNEVIWVPDDTGATGPYQWNFEPGLSGAYLYLSGAYASGWVLDMWNENIQPEVPPTILMYNGLGSSDSNQSVLWVYISHLLEFSNAQASLFSDGVQVRLYAQAVSVIEDTGDQTVTSPPTYGSFVIYFDCEEFPTSNGELIGDAPDSGQAFYIPIYDFGSSIYDYISWAEPFAGVSLYLEPDPSGTYDWKLTVTSETAGAFANVGWSITGSGPAVVPPEYSLVNMTGGGDATAVSNSWKYTPTGPRIYLKTLCTGNDLYSNNFGVTGIQAWDIYYNPLDLTATSPGDEIGLLRYTLDVTLPAGLYAFGFEYRSVINPFLGYSRSWDDILKYEFGYAASSGDPQQGGRFMSASFHIACTNKPPPWLVTADGGSITVPGSLPNVTVGKV